MPQPVEETPPATPLTRTPCILVVDDEETVRLYVRRVLEADGYAVEEAVDGAQAMNRLHAEPDRWDLVVSDIVMPRCNGVELYEHISHNGSRCPVILMSAYGSAELAGRGITPPCGVLVKPFDADRLLQEVRRCLPVAR
jgi:DNA-binding NtrC family response regulator